MVDIVQLGGSLAAILLLVALVYGLRLGPTSTLTTDAEAFAAARRLDDGFDPVAAAIDPAGKAALVRSTDGSIMALRAHGAHYAGRVLNGNAYVNVSAGTALVDPGEARFGTITLQLGEDAQAWADAINALSDRHA